MNQATKCNEAVLYVDTETALERLQGNRQVYRMSLATFLKNSVWEDVVDAVGKGELELAVISLQSIKMIASNLSFWMLLQQASHLEDQLKGGIIDQSALERFEAHWRKTCCHVRHILNAMEAGVL